MTNFKVDIIQIRASSYDSGYKLGKYIKDKPQLSIVQQMTKSEIDIVEMETLFRSYSPNLLEEIRGIADGIDISYEKACAMFSGYDVPKTEAMGCTSFVTNEYYVRNYDFTPLSYDGIFTLSQPTTSFATAGYNLQLIGRHDGVNENGLVAGLHFVSNFGYRKGISAWISLRMILDCCSNVGEAIYMLKDIPRAACYNFSLSDASGEMAVVEASPEKVTVRKEEQFLSCENHFKTKQMSKFNRKVIDGSIKRHSYLETLKQGHSSQREMFDHFRNTDSPLFFKEYEQLFGTLHTFSFGFNDSRILTTIALSDDILDVKFDEWVNGKNVEKDYLIGEIKES